MSKFKAMFPGKKPLIGMLHLAGNSRAHRISIALEEANILEEAGFDGMIVENYFGPTEDVRPVLNAILSRGTRLKVGVNVLGNDQMAFDLAASHPIDFLQIDSVCGHLPPEKDRAFAENLERMRAGCSVALLGGVRFKYQSVRSGRSEAEDVLIGAGRCDGIVVTSDGTGKPTETSKVMRFREVVGPDYPLIIGAGLTGSSVASEILAADGGIVGSWLKEGHIDRGRMNLDHASEFVSRANGSHLNSDFPGFRP